MIKSYKLFLENKEDEVSAICKRYDIKNWSINPDKRCYLKMMDKKHIKSFNEHQEKLFNSNRDRELWIKLNAERQILFDKNSYDENGNPYSNALNPRSMEDALKISKNQCEYDEKQGKMRYSLEELILLDYDGLKAISDQKHKDWWNKFNSL